MLASRWPAHRIEERSADFGVLSFLAVARPRRSHRPLSRPPDNKQVSADTWRRLTSSGNRVEWSREDQPSWRIGGRSALCAQVALYRLFPGLLAHMSTSTTRKKEAGPRVPSCPLIPPIPHTSRSSIRVSWSCAHGAAWLLSVLHVNSGRWRTWRRETWPAVLAGFSLGIMVPSSLSCSRSGHNPGPSRRIRHSQGLQPAEAHGKADHLR